MEPGTVKQLENKHPVVQKVEAELERMLGDYGYELVDVSYKGQLLSVYIDKPGGVSLADCQEIAEPLSVLLDLLDPIPQSYQLVVSSPGVERPLTRDNDFERFAGKAAAVTYSDEGGKTTREGILLGLADDNVLLEMVGEVVRIPLCEIDGAHLVYDFDGGE